MSRPNLPVAKLVPRLGALVYDLFLLFAVGFAYSALAMAIAVSLGIELDQDHISVVSEGDSLMMQAEEEFSPALSGPIFQSGLAITYLLFYLGFWKFRSATLGMQTWRLKLVSDSGEKPSLAKCLLRSVLGFLSLAIFGIGYFWMLFDPQKITFHDRYSNTRIIRLEKPAKK
mgnify:FL=1